MVAQMALRADVRPVLVELRPFLCASSWSADSLMYNFDMEGSRPYDLGKPLPVVCPLQPSLFDAQKPQPLPS
jgi:hypothetical protein